MPDSYSLTPSTTRPITPELLAHATQIVQQGGVLAYPTEAVWGLGCDPSNEQAIQRILTLKQRPWEKGLVVVAANFEQLTPWLLPLNDEHQHAVLATWEQPQTRAITWVLPCLDTVSPLLRGVHHSLAVRVSKHPLVQQLCTACGPLVSTSANPAGAEPALTEQQVLDYFTDELNLLIPGELGQQTQPSKIRTLSGQVLR